MNLTMIGAVGAVALSYNMPLRGPRPLFFAAQTPLPKRQRHVPGLSVSFKSILHIRR
jgi:hypothetical protein